MSDEESKKPIHPYATIDDEAEEEKETEALKGLTGVSSVADPTSRRITASHGHLYSSGGIVGSPPGYTTTTGTSSTPHWIPSTFPMVPAPTTPAAKKSSKDRFVRLPSRFTKKMLLAILDEEVEDGEDDVIWAANLMPEEFELRLEDGELKLHISFSLEDHYGNNDTED